ncbi:MAG: toll/interleukin-1 receptor domain-containing protein [Geminicoccaceae bacterium]
MEDQSNIFVSYSHRDEGSKNLIVSHLRAAEHQGELAVWDDQRLDGGDDRRDEIDSALESADIGILLISQHFLTSNFIMDDDVKSLLKRKQREGLRFYPVLLDSCNWKAIDWLGRLDAKLLNARPLDSFDDAQRECQASIIAAEIVDLLEEDHESRMQIEKLRAETKGLGERLGVTEEAAQSFLTILGRRHVKRADLREKLNEITKHYVRTKTQFSGLRSDDPIISQLIDQAKSAFGLGDFDKAEKRLTQAEHHDLCAAGQANASADHRRLDAAATRALRGETNLTCLRYSDAAEHFFEAAALVPHERHTIKAEYLSKQGSALVGASRSFDAIAALEGSITLDPNQTWPLISLGGLYRQAGKQAAAKATFEDALKVATKAQQKRDIATIYVHLGDVALDADNLDVAQAAYEKSHRLRFQLASEHADDEDIQQDMSEVLEKIGDICRQQGEVDGAYSAYVASLGISRKIIDRNQKKLEGYYHIAKRLRNVGDIHVDRGDLEDALTDYRESLRIIIEEVIAKERRKHRWHRDLTVCHNKVGDVLRALGDLDGALEEYQAGLAIREQVTDSDSSNTKWQRDLLASSNKIGSVRFALGDLSGALEAYEESRKIALGLANSDPGHAGWQSDLSITHEKIGDVSMELGDHDGAFEAYTAADAIRRDLASKDPGNADWQRGLIISRAKLAGLAEAQRMSDAALGNWRAALVIAAELEQSGRLAPDDAWMVDDLRGRIDALGAPPAPANG